MTHHRFLLIGLAIGGLATGSAQAADAVASAEPEPLDLVAVCDAYGVGYWYIPGTETCIKLGGQVRYDKRLRKDGGAKSVYNTWTRARIELAAKTESELGTVASWLRIQNNVRDNVPGQTVAYYTFGIGGLEVGYQETKFAQIGGFGGRTEWGGTFVNQTYAIRQYVSYTAEIEKFRATLSLEQDANRDTMLPGDGANNRYMPDVVAGIRGSVDKIRLAAVAAYDESDESYASAAFVRGTAGKFGWTIAGFYASSAANSYFSHDGFSALAGASYAVTDQVTLASDLQVWDNRDYRIIGDINWGMTPNFRVLLEGSYGSIADVTTRTAMLRIERNF